MNEDRGTFWWFVLFVAIPGVIIVAIALASR